MSNTRPSLAAKASQVSLASLMELDPMPMPDSPLLTPQATFDSDKELHDSPTGLGSGAGSPYGAQHGHSRSISGEKGTTATLGLSHGHGHSSIYYCELKMADSGGREEEEGTGGEREFKDHLDY